MDGLWLSLYNLLIGLIGSGSTYLWGDYTCQVLATIGTIFVFVIPFIVVYYCIRFIFGLMR